MLRATCVKIIIETARGWQITGQNKKEARETESRTGAEKGSCSVPVKLFRNEVADQIGALFATARALVRNVSPDNGELVPAAILMETKARLTDLQNELSVLRDKLRINYPAYVQAEQKRLGTLFDASRYPSTEDVIKGTVLAVRVEPMPDADLFRYATCLADDEIDQLREENEATMREYNDRIEATLTARLIKAIDHAHGIIKRFHEGGKRFTYGIPEALAIECGTISDINVIGHAGIAQACNDAIAACPANGGQLKDVIEGGKFCADLEGIKRALLGVADAPTYKVSLDTVPDDEPETVLTDNDVIVDDGFDDILADLLGSL